MINSKWSSEIKYYIPLLLLPIVNIIESIMIKSGMLVSSGVKNLLSAFVWVCAEEIVFRKAVPAFLEKYTNIEVRKRCIIEAAAFSLAHLLNLSKGEAFGAVIVQMAVAFGVGYVFAVLIKLNKNILPCIAVHFLLNLTGTAADYAVLPVFRNVVWLVLAFGCTMYGNWIFKRRVWNKDFRTP